MESAPDVVQDYSPHLSRTYVYSFAVVRGLITFFAEDISAWKEKQAAHYKAHPYKDPKHAALWQNIQEYWDDSLTGATEDLTSRSASSLMMRVRDDFSKSVSLALIRH